MSQHTALHAQLSDPKLLKSQAWLDGQWVDASSRFAITNPADGTACIATDELANVFAPEFVDALRTAAVDETSAPFELPGVGWVVITLRPFDEVADDAAAIMSTGGSGDFIRNMADGAEVWVSSKYGTFDPTLPGVVPVG